MYVAKAGKEKGEKMKKGAINNKVGKISLTKGGKEI